MFTVKDFGRKSRMERQEAIEKGEVNLKK